MGHGLCALCVNSHQVPRKTGGLVGDIWGTLFNTYGCYNTNTSKKSPKLYRFFTSMNAQSHYQKNCDVKPARKRNNTKWLFQGMEFHYYRKMLLFLFTVTNKGVIQSHKHFPLVGRRPFLCVCSLSRFSVENTPQMGFIVRFALRNSFGFMETFRQTSFCHCLFLCVLCSTSWKEGMYVPGMSKDPSASFTRLWEPGGC